MKLIKNGRVIDPKGNTDEMIDIIIKDDKIYKIGKNICTQMDFDEVIDASGKIVAPGLIDVHVHFRDPGFTYKEDMQTGSNSAAKGGFTTVVCMANTSPLVDNEDTLSYIINEAKNLKINILQTATITKGLKGNELVDMNKLKACGAVGFTDDGVPIMDADIVKKAMIKAKELNVPLSFHEEDPMWVGNYGINKGEISDKLNMIGAPDVAEYEMVARDCAMAIKTGARINIQHVSSAISVDIIRLAKVMGANVMAEVTPHHFALTEDAVIKYKSYAKMNPPLRTEFDRIKLIEGIKDNTIEIIATDHAPHSTEEKEKDFNKAPSGIIGLETALSLGITHLVREGHINMMELIQKMTVNPAKLYNLKSGSISEGEVADIVIFDPTEKWTVTDFLSKSSNSPFIGHELYGKVKYTICTGNIVYKD